MSDWAVGDLAVRVRVKKTAANAHRFTKKGAASPVGKIYRVVGVIEGFGPVGLIIHGYPSPHETGAWGHEMFRKIRPDKHESCEPEFVTLLKRNRVKA